MLPIAAADGNVILNAVLVSASPNPRLDRAIIEARHDLHQALDPPGQPLQGAKDLPMTAPPAVGAAGQAVDEPGGAGVGLEGGFQHQGVGQVAA